MKLLISTFLIVMFSLIYSEITSICEDIPSYLCNSGAPRTDGCAIIDSRGPESTKVSLMKSSDVPSRNINNFVSCGKRNLLGVGPRRKRDLVNVVEFGEFPWMVAILQEENVDRNRSSKILTYLCGASLIHPEVVLTSAQCVEKQRRRLRIRAGEWNSATNIEIYIHQEREVIDIIIHPDYNEQGLFNDVALLILDSPLKLTPHVQTICLPSQNEVIESSLKCIATGWGKNSFEHNDKYQEILKKVELPIVQRDVCQEQLRTFALGNYYILDKSFICAGGVPGEDMCAGDGGSPLICPIPFKKGRYHQTGLVSWGIGCGNQIPAVYGNVAAFRNWIDNEMYKLNFNKSTYIA